MLKHFLPKTVVGQLMALLAVVLIFAQMINLALLVGSQRLQAQTYAFDAAVEQASRLIVQLPEDLYLDLPYHLEPELGGLPGSFFLSGDNTAEQFDDAKQLGAYNVLFKETLEENGIFPFATSVTFLAKSPIGKPRQGDRVRPPRDRGPMDRGTRPNPNMGDGVYLPPPPRRGLGFNPAVSEGAVPLQELRLSAELEEGVWFNALLPHEASEPLRVRILLATLLLMAVALFAVWGFARRISRPISAFVDAAENLGRGNATELLPETGPTDMRDAAVAFNNMQTRLTRMLETQRNMLRAVGHDLRTPLTSLRLRAENIQDDAEREKVVSTLNDMAIMTEEVLSWAKDASGTEDVATVDLGSLLESIVDDYQDQGKKVELNPVASMTVAIRRVSIKRAVQNIVNNAVQYGGGAMLSVQLKANRVCIHVDDQGPGVTADQLENILKPFVRLESSRNKETGGTGLGLSIADTIAQIHGGTLVLTNREQGGLRASLSLPT